MAGIFCASVSCDHNDPTGNCESGATTTCVGANRRLTDPNCNCTTLRDINPCI